MYYSGSQAHHFPQHRLGLVTMAFGICFTVIVVRLFSVALSQHTVDLGYDMASSGDALFNRASITDRNGMLLAVNLTTASLYADPKMIIDADEVVRVLAGVFDDINPDILKMRLTSNKRFVWLKRNLTPEQQHLVNKLGIPGVYFKREESRIYPHGSLLSHVLGFTNIDGNGLAGIEKQYNSYLSDYDDQSNDKALVSLALTIDLRIQGMMYQLLSDAMEQYQAKGVGGIVMDVNNGDVLAMVSLPDFDPHEPSIASDAQLFNQMTLGVYEMGSTFKIHNVAMALESGKISMDDAYDVSKPLKVSQFTIRDYHPTNGVMSVPQIFIHSSNIGSAQMAVEVGQNQQQAFLEKLGMLSELNLQLPEKSYPLLPPKWGKASTMTISYGHGIAVTPVHLVQSVASLVNGGIWHDANLIKRNALDSYYDGRRVVSKNTSDNVRKLMRLAVSHGTGKRADVEGYLVGGKTGSADKAKKGQYERSDIMASFIGAFPMHQPKYVVFVMVDEPKRKSRYDYVTGGVVAAPIVGKLIERIAPMLGIYPVDEDDERIRQEFWYHDDEDTKNAQLASL